MSTLAVSQIFHFFACKLAVVARLQVAEADFADGNSLKFLDRVAHCGKHLTHLAVLAFVN